MLLMCIVNLGYGTCYGDDDTCAKYGATAQCCFTYQSILPSLLIHGITFCSGPDLILPAFHFVAGFAMRLSLPRRVLAASARTVLKPLFEVCHLYTYPDPRCSFAPCAFASWA